MEKMFDIAGYIMERYQRENGIKIDEMKLHKLMYFAQRESYIQNDCPLFEGTFRGWKYGPILKEIRGGYKDDSFPKIMDTDIGQRIAPVMDMVFADFSHRESMSLSSLSHGELSWKNSREGIGCYENSDNPMSNEDIRKDAQRIKMRMAYRKMSGLD